MPQHKEGIRIEPAMSLPTPRGEPLKATRAPSLPVEPPAVRVVLCGLRVRPKRLFSESAVYQMLGYDVFWVRINAYHHCLRKVSLAVQNCSSVE